MKKVIFFAIIALSIGFYSFITPNGVQDKVKFSDFVKEFPKKGLPLRVEGEKIDFNDLDKKKLDGKYRVFVDEEMGRVRFSRIPVEVQITPEAIIAQNSHFTSLIFAVHTREFRNISSEYRLVNYDANGKIIDKISLARVSDSNYGLYNFAQKAVIDEQLNILTATFLTKNEGSENEAYDNSKDFTPENKYYTITSTGHFNEVEKHEMKTKVTIHDGAN